MTTNYLGVDQFASNLDLMQDNDPPRAQLFRVPLERVLDNTVHLRNRVERRETVSNLSSIVTRTNSTLPIVLAEKTFQAGELVAGSVIRFGAQVRAQRGATATATNIALLVRIAGSLVYGDSIPLNVTNTYVGALRNTGEITICGAPSASTPILVSGVTHSSIASTIVSGMTDSGLALTADFTGNSYFSISAQMVTGVANVDLTGLSGFIQLMK